MISMLTIAILIIMARMIVTIIIIIRKLHCIMTIMSKSWMLKC